MQHHKIRTDSGEQTKQAHPELTLHARLHWHRNSRLVAVDLELLSVRAKLGKPSLDIVDMAHSGHLPLTNTSQSTMLRAIIQSESDDTVVSSMNNDTTENFDREDCACAVRRERFVLGVCAK